MPTCGAHCQSHIKNCVHGKASSRCPSCALWAGPLMSLGPVMLALGTLGELAILVPPRMHMERRTNLNTQSLTTWLGSHPLEQSRLSMGYAGCRAPQLVIRGPIFLGKF